MTNHVRAIVLLTLAGAAVVFASVQDRVTAAGAQRYVALQRAALAGRGAPVAIDDVMVPAVRQSVRQASAWAAVVVAVGFGAAGVVSRRGTRD
jgi:hypothetical protein